MEDCTICNFNRFQYEVPCCNNILCLNCLKSVAKCPYCTKPIPNDIKNDPCIMKRYGDELYAKLPNYVWLYEGRNNGWWIYDYATIEMLEEEYAAKKSSAEVFICGFNMEIDFKTMQQINLENHAIRQVMRIKKEDVKTDGLLVKGVAGMQ